MSEGYRIPDEPRPGPLAEWAVNPFWPLLAMMLGGAWIGLPWFLFNGYAIGSATFTKEAVITVLTPVVAVALLFLGLVVMQSADWPQRALNYIIVFVTAAKLGGGYWLYSTQSPSFEIYEWFGGKVRQGMILAIVASVARSYVVGPAFKASIWLGIVVM